MKWGRLTGIDNYVEGEIINGRKYKLKTSKYWKTVLLPIKVPPGRLCWDGHNLICEHFDNEGGHGRCDLNIGSLKRGKLGYYHKPKECLDLKELY